MVEQLISLFEYVVATLGGMLLITLLSVEIVLIVILICLVVRIVKEHKKESKL